MSLAPLDDPVIPCEVRLWQGESVWVFMHPREWAKVSLIGGTPMQVACHGVEFECEICSWGEFYRSGRPKDVNPSDFDLPGHGDYKAEAVIDWDKAIPELIVDRLDGDPNLAERWKLLPSAEMRNRLNHVLRARKPSAQVQRSLELLKDLSA